MRGEDRPTKLWANQNFVRLFWAHTGSLIGNALTMAAVALLAAHLAGEENTGLVLSVVLTIRILVFVFIAPFAGRLAERMGRKQAMIWSDIFRALVVLGFLFVTETWQIYGLTLLLNLGAAFFTPVYKAVIPGITGEAAYPQALAWGSLAYKISEIAGPVLAAGFITLFTFKGNFVVDILTFLLSAALIFGVRLGRVGAPDSQNPDAKPKAKEHLLHGMRRMLCVAGLRRSLWFSLQESIAGSFMYVCTVQYVLHQLQLAEELYPVAMAMPGVGAILVSVIYGQAPGRARDFLRSSALAMMVASLVLVGFFEGYTILLVAWVLTGAGQAVLGIRSNEYLAAHSEDSERPHIYAAHFSLSHVGWGVFYLLCGILSQHLNFNAIAWIMLGILAIAALPTTLAKSSKPPVSFRCF